MTIDRKWIFAAAGLGLLGGCTPTDSGLGNALQSNNMAQIVNPEPVHEGEVAHSASQVSAAQERYRKGAVKETQAQSTRQGAGSSGGN